MNIMPHILDAVSHYVQPTGTARYPGVLTTNATGAIVGRKDNLSAGAAPIGTDDSTQGYAVGSRWIYAGKEYVCTSATPTSAVWTETTVAAPTPGGTGTELQFRSSATAFGAVTGSSFSGGAFTLPATTFSSNVTMPAESFVGPSATAGWYFKGGNVGINQTNPAFRVEICRDGNYGVNQWWAGQLALTGKTNNSYRLVLGYSTADNFGFIQAGQNLIGSTPLILNPMGGNVVIGTTTNDGVNKLQVTGSASITGNLGLGTTAPDKQVEINSANGSCLRLTYNDSNGSAANYTDFSLSSAGRLTIGTVTAATDSIANIATLTHDTSGTAAAGFGAGLAFNLETTTTAAQSAALISASWIDATHASRTARLAFSAYDSGGAREGIRIDTNGSAALIGFFGVTAVAKQTKAAHNNWAAISDVVSALVNLGLVDAA